MFASKAQLSYLYASTYGKLAKRDEIATGDYTIIHEHWKCDNGKEYYFVYDSKTKAIDSSFFKVNSRDKWHAIYAEV